VLLVTGCWLSADNILCYNSFLASGQSARAISARATNQGNTKPVQAPRIRIHRGFAVKGGGASSCCGGKAFGQDSGVQDGSFRALGGPPFHAQD